MQKITNHALDPLLAPRSIALMGASDREGSPGFHLAQMIATSEYEGAVYPVNPRYTEIAGLACYSSLDALPETVDHVVLAVSNERLEGALSDAIRHGAKAATIYSSCVLENDTPPCLQERLSKMAKEAGMAICGGSGMGFYNLDQNLRVGIYPHPKNIPNGGIAYIAHSGSAFAALAHNGCRLKFNLCVSSGNEIVTTVAHYMDWALEQDSTRVIGLFLEAVRSPVEFTAALAKAQSRGIPVVVLKVGRTPLSAEMAQTHTGAIAGEAVVYDALFRRYGVIQVDCLDELAATLMIFQGSRRAAPGQLATIHDSGGLRELSTDIAVEAGVPFANITDETKACIQEHLDPGLKAENPLDAWGTNNNFETTFHASLTALLADPNTAVGGFFGIFRDGYYLSEAFLKIALDVNAKTDKLLFLVNCYSDIQHEKICLKATEQGIPVIDGTKEAILAIKHFITFRDFQARQKPSTDHPIDNIKSGQWRERLSQSEPLNEFEALSLLQSYGIAVPNFVEAASEDALVKAAQSLFYPLVLKTSVPGINHKSDVQGVALNIQDVASLKIAYADFSTRLGPEVIASEMVGGGVEIGLGAINDAQFGPAIVVAAGGIMIELLEDKTVELAPFGKDVAHEMLNSLRINRLLEGARGQSVCDKDALATLISRLSWLITDLKDVIEEIDVNPVIASPSGAIAVDALIISKRK